MRRRKKSSSGASLDSLLDTMTNVVGILVILLVVTQLGVSDAVKRISANAPKISVEELEQVQQDAADHPPWSLSLSGAATSQRRRYALTLHCAGKRARDRARTTSGSSPHPAH